MERPEMYPEIDLYTFIETCPVCGSRESDTIQSQSNIIRTHCPEDQNFFESYNRKPSFLKKCRNCDFIFADRLPRDPDYFKRHYNCIKWDWEKEFKEHGKKFVFKDAKNKIKKYFKSGSLLDIGAWCGTFMNEMKDSFSTTGYDINEGASAFGRSMGLDIRSGDFCRAGFTKESFGIITLIDVLEHLPNPKEHLRTYADLLKPGGILYVKVPNAGPQIKKEKIKTIFGFHSDGVAVNFVHINHFSYKSLASLLRSIGLDIMEEGYAKVEFRHNYACPQYHRKIIKYFINSGKMALSLAADFISSVTFLDIGLNIYMIGKKPKRG